MSEENAASTANSASSSAKLVKSMLAAGASAAAVFAGFAATPTLFSGSAHAQRIDPPPIAAPGGAPTSFAGLIEHVSPAVVSISVRQKLTARRGQDFDNLPSPEDLLRPDRGPRRAPQSLGSGFIIAENGTIVTNNHVVEDADEIEVRLSDERQFKAELVGTDPNTDLAVLRIKDGGRFPFVSLDTTPSVRVGDWVVAVGSPFGLDGTVTAGIVSAKGRRGTDSNYVDFIQIDAPINRGNSGGPTFDLKGNVIGVNSAIFSPTGGNVGIGFAIPSDVASRVVDQLIKSGRVTRGWLGVQVQPVDKEIAASLGLKDAKGALVGTVTPGSPAAAAGLQNGDVILTFNGAPVGDSRDLTQKVGSAVVGKDAKLEVQRNGAKRIVNVRLGERPSEQQLAGSGIPGRPGGAPGASATEAVGIGVSVRAITDEERKRLSLDGVTGGLVILDIEDNSPLIDRVNIGEVILGYGADRKALATVEELNAALQDAKKADRPILLNVLSRGGQSRYVGVRVN